MENYGLSTVASILGDKLVYRNLEPMDGRLPSFAEIAAHAGIPGSTVPRKTELDYACVMVEMLKAARALNEPGAVLRRLVCVGDTRMNDGIAFRHLCQVGGWTGMAFIGSETADAVRVELVREGESTLYLANRWGMLEEFDRYCQTQGFPIDAETAIVLDLDKTTWGARGRNDHVIDEARLQAVRQTVKELLGSAFDMAQFEESYSLLNRTEFHPFTTDNQDYLAYICLILGSDLFTLPVLVEQIRTGHLKSFAPFMEAVEARVEELPEQLHSLHTGIYERVKAGDPTPFKAFRYNEYRMTVGRMGQLNAKAGVQALLAHEIVITQEVREAAEGWKQQGALLFGMSDKPDEASVPCPELADEGFQPLHRTATHVVGGGPLTLFEPISPIGASAS
jgi:hypothetical protein